MRTKQFRRSEAEEREARNNVIYYSVGLLLILYIWWRKHHGDEVEVAPSGAVYSSLRIQQDVDSAKSTNIFDEDKTLKAVPKKATQYSNAAGRDLAADGIDDTVTAIVECETTKGKVVIDVRRGWSPKGADQYIKIVDSGHFDDLPFTRVAPRYITQYGRKYIAPDSPQQGYLRRAGVSSIADDPTMWGKRDMDFGYVFFAGSGKDSRYDEMVIALCPMKGCIQTGLGKAFWETPVGTIRKEYHDVLREIQLSGKPYPRLEMAGQHPRASGPNAGRLMREPDYLKKEYPFMEYWRGCNVVERDVVQIRPLSVDYPGSEQHQSGTQGKKKNTADSGGAVTEVSEPFRVKISLILDRSQPTVLSPVILEIIPSWAPKGATQFKSLVQAKFYDDSRIFRVIPKFMNQFGISGVAGAGNKYKAILDDPSNVPESGGNVRGTISFATSGKNTRTTQLFINTANNNFLDKQGFTPFGKVIEGLDIWESVNSQYREEPNQGSIQNQGNAYLDSKFPELTAIESIRII
jgi:peptidyl-prolyl cis-trans isomerase A (cyclophilin A)